MSRLLPELLQTERLVLREPRDSDAAALFAAYTQDIEVARYMVWRPHTALLETEGFIAQCRRDWADGLRQAYVLAVRENTSQPIGMLDARVSAHTVDIGYVLASACWGKGIMPEAVRALTGDVLSRPGFFRVQATCDVENRASARTLEKAGFVLEGRLERLLVHPNVSAEPRACFLYARCR